MGVQILPRKLENFCGKWGRPNVIYRENVVLWCGYSVPAADDGVTGLVCSGYCTASIRSGRVHSLSIARGGDAACSQITLSSHVIINIMLYIQYTRLVSTSL